MAFVDPEYTINPEDQNYYDLNEYNLNDDENYFNFSNKLDVQLLSEEIPMTNTDELIKEIFETRELIDELILNDLYRSP